LSSKKYAPIGSRRIVAEPVGPGVNWLQKLQFQCSEADCKLRHVVGGVLNTALRGIWSNDIASRHKLLGNFAQALPPKNWREAL
jgi:hypothetical protein